jgi:hypothetical protein
VPEFKLTQPAKLKAGRRSRTAGNAILNLFNILYLLFLSGGRKNPY